MDCTSITESTLLTRYFKCNDEPLLTRAFTCFNNLYFEEFLRFSHSEGFFRKSYTKYKAEELVREAFNDALLSFYLFIREKGFEERGATVKTVFFEFCKRKLWGLTKTLQRRSVKYFSGDPELVIDRENLADGFDQDALEAEMEKMDLQEDTLNKAFTILGERCTDIIVWRKLNNLSDEAISQRTGLTPRSVNNEVYKCFKTLKKIIQVEINNTESQWK